MAEIEIPVRVTITPELLAKAFCELDDDTQAKFFVEVARIMRSWGAVPWNMQPFLIGEHLRECKCSTDDARDLIENIHSAMVLVCERPLFEHERAKDHNEVRELESRQAAEAANG